MALTNTGGIVRENLVVDIDAERASANYPNTNLLAPYPWYTGAGSETFYGQNGDGNSRSQTGSGPFGATIVWNVSNQDATSDADGGWNSSNFPVDQNKMYRFSVWIRRRTIGNGSVYLGTYGKNSAGSNIGVRWLTSTSTTTNPYFTARGWPGVANDWYLFVGHVHPYGTGVEASAHPDSGIWDMNGNKIVNENRDMVWLDGTTQAIHRTYLYYSTDTSTNQQWWHPRVDVCDGNEPTLQDLLNGVGANFSIRSYSSSRALQLEYATWEPRYGLYPANFKLTPSLNSRIYIDTEGDNRTIKSSGGWTVESWVKFDSVAGAYDGGDRSPANFIGASSITHNSWYWSVLNNKLALWNRSPGIWKYGSTTLQAGQYYQAVLVCYDDGTRYQMYLNGEAEGGDHVSYVWNSAYAGLIIDTLGYGNFPNPRKIDGDYNVFRAYDRALSAKEIKQNYNALKGRFGH